MNKVMRAVLLLIIVAFSGWISAQDYPFMDVTLTAEDRAVDLCSRLTLEEKASMMMHGSPAVGRFGIPSFDWWNEALHGVARNGYATVFPIPMAMAASFDDELLLRVFTAVSDEARAKNVIARRSGEVKRYQGLSFWTPNINIFRDPRWGRGQETYGEDPFLTSRMGLAVVKGLQGPSDSKYRKLLACAKHYAVHSGPEWNRHTFNIEDLPERDLWETYLPAFKTLVQEGNVAEVMCAYQRIDGDPCCGNKRYLGSILRDEWGFGGIVVSDCWAISDFYIKEHHGVSETAAEASAKAVLSGTDLECGVSYAALPEAVRKGYISEEEVDESITKLLKLYIELGEMDADSLVEWKQIPDTIVACKAHHQLALDMARESMVLLKNDGILPLSPQNNKIVVVGPNATDSILMWGNYNGYPLATTTILQGIQQIAGDVRYVGGCGLTKNATFNSRYDEMFTPEGRKGMRATYWNNPVFKGSPAAVEVLAQPINQSNGGATAFAPGVNLVLFSAKYEGIFRPTRSEAVSFLMDSDDLSRLIVNGDTIIDSWKSRERANTASETITVEAGKEYDIQIDYVQYETAAVMKFDLGVSSQIPPTQFVESVGDADIVIFVGGISARLEGEEMSIAEDGFRGGDREHIELPEAQRDLIAALAESGKKIVYVNCSGSAVGLEPEVSNCSAIVQAWYGGEAGGQALAEVLFGEVNPSGKLPVTFYKNVDQLPDFLDYTMKGRTYRYFEGEPLYPFGYGLSYTSFEVGFPSYCDGEIKVDVRNTGQCAGTETIQVYIKRPDDADGPIKTLRGFKRISLDAGETIQVSIPMPRERFESWDKVSSVMRVIPGKYDIMVGTSSREADLKTIHVIL